MKINYKELLLHCFELYFKHFYRQWYIKNIKALKIRLKDAKNDLSDIEEYKDNIKLKYHSIGKIETILLFQFYEDSICLVSHGKSVRLCVMENKSNWIQTISSIPLWSDFTKEFNEYLPLFKELKEASIQKLN